jgi:hypothetical protein
MRHTLLALLIALAPLAARADEAPPPPRRWFGWQTLLADVGAFGLAAVLAENDGPGTVAFAAYCLGSPAIHLANGDPGGAGGSLALHLFLPAGGALAGAAAASGCEKGWLDFCQLEAAAEGALIGLVLTTLLDTAVLAWTPAHEEPRLTVRAAVTGERAWVGVRGSF